MSKYLSKLKRVISLSGVSLALLLMFNTGGAYAAGTYYCPDCGEKIPDRLNKGVKISTETVSNHSFYCEKQGCYGYCDEIKETYQIVGHCFDCDGDFVVGEKEVTHHETRCGHECPEHGQYL